MEFESLNEQENSSNDLYFLEQQNKRLETDLASVKKQFEAALNSFSDSDSLRRENAELKKEIAKLQENKSDLENRFEISIKNNKDLQKKCESLSNSAKIGSFQEKKTMKQKIDNLNDTLKEKEEKFSKEILEINEKTSEISKNNMILIATQNKTLSLAKCFFKTDFLDINEFHSFLSNPQQETHNNEDKTKDDSVNENYFEEISKLNSKLMKEKGKKRDLEIQVLELQQEWQSSIHEKESTILQLTEALRASQNEKKALQLDYETKIAKINADNNPMKKEEFTQCDFVNKSESFSLDAEDEPEDDEKMKEMENKLKEAKQNIFELKKQNSELLRKIKANEDNRKKENIKNAMKNEEKQEASIEDLKNEIANKEKDIIGITNQFHAAKASNKEANTAFIAAKQESERIKQTISHFIDQLNSQRNEIESLYKERFNLISLLQKQNALYSYQAPIQREEKEEIPEEETKQKQKIEEEINFDFSELPNEIQNSLSKIHNNKCASLSTRIQLITKVIARYIESQRNQKEEEIRNLEKELSNEKKAKENIVTGVSTLFGTDITEENLIEFILGFIKEYNNAQDDLQLIHETNEDFLSKMKVESFDQIVDQFNEQNKLLEVIGGKLMKSKERNAKLREDVVAFKTALAKTQKKYEKELLCVNKSIEKAEEESRYYEEKYSEIQKKNIDLVNEINNNKDKHVDEIKELKEHYEYLLEQNQSEVRGVTNGFTAKFGDAKKENKELIKQNQKLEEEIENLTLTTKAAFADLSQSRKEFDELAAEFEKYKLKTDEERTKENIAKDKKHEDVVKALNERLNEDSGLIKKTTKALEANEQRIQTMIAKTAALENQLMAAEVKLQTQNEEFSRSKRLLEAQMKAAIMSNDIKATDEIDAAQRKFEEKEISIYTKFAHVFHKFFDASVKIDEKTFNKAVGSVSDELSRLETLEHSVRNLCNANQGEKTEDALSQFILSAFC